MSRPTHAQVPRCLNLCLLPPAGGAPAPIPPPSLLVAHAAQVPQLSEVNAVLQATTGWSIRPVAGLMHPRHFLAGLAFR